MEKENKEDILERSRQSHKDEGMEYAENQGHKTGFIVFTLLFAVLAILSLFFWQIGTLYAISSLFWTHFAAEAYYKYRFTKKKKYLITAVFGSIAAIISVANFILVVLR